MWFHFPHLLSLGGLSFSLSSHPPSHLSWFPLSSPPSLHTLPIFLCCCSLYLEDRHLQGQNLGWNHRNFFEISNARVFSSSPFWAMLTGFGCWCVLTLSPPSLQAVPCLLQALVLSHTEWEGWAGRSWGHLERSVHRHSEARENMRDGEMIRVFPPENLYRLTQANHAGDGRDKSGHTELAEPCGHSSENSLESAFLV